MLSGDLWDKLWSQQQKDAGDVNLQSLPEPTPVRKTKAAKNAIIYSDIYIYIHIKPHLSCGASCAAVTKRTWVSQVKSLKTQNPHTAHKQWFYEKWPLKSAILRVIRYTGEANPFRITRSVVGQTLQTCALMPNGHLPTFHKRNL